VKTVICEEVRLPKLFLPEDKTDVGELCNRLFDLPDLGYNYLQLVVGTDPSQRIYRGN